MGGAGRVPHATGRIRRAFSVVRSMPMFPATVVTASTSISGEAAANSSARASSTPGSVSMMTGSGCSTLLGEPDHPLHRRQVLDRDGEVSDDRVLAIDGSVDLARGVADLGV